MNLKLAVKLFALISALTATVVAMIWLRQGHMNSIWTSLGVDRSGQRLNWCLERVSSLYFYQSQSKLLEKDGKWLWAKNEESVELDYLRIEKWFAKHCLAKVESFDSPEGEMPKPLVEARFINGDRITIHQFTPGIFEIQNKAYRSDSLQEGIKELLAFDKKIE